MEKSNVIESFISSYWGAVTKYAVSTFVSCVLVFLKELWAWFLTRWMTFTVFKKHLSMTVTSCILC